jgi:hypothetical protein
VAELHGRKLLRRSSSVLLFFSVNPFCQVACSLIKCRLNVDVPLFFFCNVATQQTSTTRTTIVHSNRRNIAKMVTSFLSDQAVKRFLRQFQLGQRFACFQSFVSNQGQCGLRRKGPPVHKTRFNFDPSELPALHANNRFVALHYVACILSQAQE